MRTRLRTASLLAFLAALLASPALAVEAEGPSPADQDVVLNAETPKVCALGENSATQVALGVIAQTGGAEVGRLRTDLGERVVTVDAWCNTSSAINVTAQALLGPSFSDTPATAVFARSVNFRASALGWTEDETASPSITSNADRLGGGQASLTSPDANYAGPNEATISIRLDQWSAPANALLVSGDYQGAVVVTITPL